jgi:hypothetical protein
MPSAFIREWNGAQALMRDDDVADMRACDVEGLGRRRHHHQPVEDVGRGERHDGVLVAGHQQVVMDLV